MHFHLQRSSLNSDSGEERKRGKHPSDRPNVKPRVCKIMARKVYESPGLEPLIDPGIPQFGIPSRIAVVHLTVFKTPCPSRWNKAEHGRRNYWRRRGGADIFESNGMRDFKSARVRSRLRLRLRTLILNQRQVNRGCFRFRVCREDRAGRFFRPTREKASIDESRKYREINGKSPGKKNPGGEKERTPSDRTCPTSVSFMQL